VSRRNKYRGHKSKRASRRPQPRSELANIGIGLAGIVLAFLTLLANGGLRVLLAFLTAAMVSAAILFVLFKPLFGGWAGFADILSASFRYRIVDDWKDLKDYPAAVKFLFWLFSGFGIGIMVFVVLRGL
jgi:hypothetical protein